jgi:ATP-dependent protease ClpP protease subunit
MEMQQAKKLKRTHDDTFDKELKAQNIYENRDNKNNKNNKNNRNNKSSINNKNKKLKTDSDNDTDDGYTTEEINTTDDLIHNSDDLTQNIRLMQSGNDIKMIKFPDKNEKCIFTAGDNEIHFNTCVDIETITRLKCLISKIIDKNKKKLVKYDEFGNVPSDRAKDPVVTITYVVNSPGGSVHDVLDFVDYIGELRATFYNIRFTSIITGLVASAGTIMCVIADKRKMTRFAFAMIHELSTGMARTNYTRIMTHAEFIRNLHNALVIIYQESRMIPLNDVEKTRELERMLIEEKWMRSDEYKNHGFVDEIIAGNYILRKN